MGRLGKGLVENFRCTLGLGYFNSDHRRHISSLGELPAIVEGLEMLRWQRDTVADIHLQGSGTALQIGRQKTARLTNAIITKWMFLEMSLHRLVSLSDF